MKFRIFPKMGKISQCDIEHIFNKGGKYPDGGRVACFFPPICNMEGKLSTQKVRFFQVYLQIVRAKFQNAQILTLKIFVNVECDWNSKISQNVCFFSKKNEKKKQILFLENLNFFKIV